jgi:hypothetical protein
MQNRIIKLGIDCCVVSVLAIICHSEVCAALIQEVQADGTEVVIGIETSEDNQETPDVVLAENEETESTEPNKSTATIATFTPNEYYRIVTVGDLPEDHDPSLVLRKGRTIKAAMLNDIRRETSFQDRRSFSIQENIYDDSGHILLLHDRTRIICLYKISEKQDIFKVNLTALDMQLDLYRNISVRFSNPPHCTTSGYRKQQAFELTNLSSDDEKKIVDEYLQLKEQLFISPVISAELVFGVESEDRTSLRGRVMFDEDPSGDKTIIIKAGYMVNLHVEKDILFSGPFIDR